MIVLLLSFNMASFRLNAEVLANSMPKRNVQTISDEMDIICLKNECIVQKLLRIRVLFYDKIRSCNSAGGSGIRIMSIRIQE